MALTRFYCDLETIGFHGVPILFQYGTQEPGCDPGPIHVIDIWTRSVSELKALIEYLAECHYIGFNNAFDLFHVNKLYNMLSMCENPSKPPQVEEMARIEPLARGGKLYTYTMSGEMDSFYSPYTPVAVIPRKNTDLYIVARRGHLQSTQERKNVRIKLVPEQIVDKVVMELEALLTGNKRIKGDDTLYEISDIHFAKATKHTAYMRAQRWYVTPSKQKGFYDIVLKFRPSAALKPLMREIFKIKVHSYPAPERQPAEKKMGFCTAAMFLSSDTHGQLSKYQDPEFCPIAKPGQWRANYYRGKKPVTKGYTWPALVQEHRDHWSKPEPQLYAADDVSHLFRLHNHWFNEQDQEKDSDVANSTDLEVFTGPNIDIDSELTAYVAATRWRGFDVDFPRVREAYYKALQDAKDKPKKQEVLDSLPPIVVSCMEKTPTGAPKLDKAQLEKAEMTEYPLVRKLYNTSRAEKVAELLRKIIQANGRLHASLKVFGTLTHRMAGADDLNVQAIQSDFLIRSLFTLRDTILNERNVQGDFESFEVIIAESVYQDAVLNRIMRTCEDCGGEAVPAGFRLKCGSCGSFEMRKVHAIMGSLIYPPHTYEQVRASKGKKHGELIDMYTNGKRAVFGSFYGGDHHTINKKIAIPIDIAEVAYRDFFNQFPQMLQARLDVAEEFTSLKQIAGQGSRIDWRESRESISNLFGDKRYFHLENKIVKMLYNLAQSLPEDFVPEADRKITVIRREDRKQTLRGATQTALYAAAFALQGIIIRAGTNMVIQSTGARATKLLQYLLCDGLQPRGIHPWRARTMQVHDSLSVVQKDSESIRQETAKIIQHFLDRLRKKIEFLALDWNWDAKSLAD